MNYKMSTSLKHTKNLLILATNSFLFGFTLTDFRRVSADWELNRKDNKLLKQTR